MKPDHALISLAKAGDQSAWCDLLQRHEGAMRRLVAKGVQRGYDENDVWSYVHEKPGRPPKPKP